MRAAQGLLAVEVVQEITDRLLVERDALAVALVAQDAADAIMVQIAELLPPGQRGEFSDLPALGRRLAGITKPVNL